MQDRGIRLMQVHTELLGVLYCGQRAVFWGSLPALPSIRATNLLRLWDYEALLSEEVHHTACCHQSFRSAHETPSNVLNNCSKRPIKRLSLAVLDCGWPLGEGSHLQSAAGRSCSSVRPSKCSRASQFQGKSRHLLGRRIRQGEEHTPQQIHLDPSLPIMPTSL